jgi:hypothetical protein
LTDFQLEVASLFFGLPASKGYVTGLPCFFYSPGASARMFFWPARHRSTRALRSGSWLPHWIMLAGTDGSRYLASAARWTANLSPLLSS